MILLVFYTKMCNHLLVQCNTCLTWGLLLPFIVTCRPFLLILFHLFSINLAFRNPEIPSCNIHIHSLLFALFQRWCPCLLHFKFHSTLHFHGEELLVPDTTSFLKNQPCWIPATTCSVLVEGATHVITLCCPSAYCGCDDIHPLNMVFR